MQRSEVGNIGLHLARIGAELDRFLEFRDGDAVRRRDTWTSALQRPLPEQGIGAQAVVDELAETVIPNGARMAAPGFSSWITTGPDTVAVAAAAAASLAAPQRYTITAFNLLEELSLDWLAELCGIGGRMQGVYSSGGSVANLVALGAARQWALEQAGIDPSADGLGGRELALYASVESHHTVPRSAAVLGIGRSRVRLIATDEQQRMRIDLLRSALEEDVVERRAAGGGRRHGGDDEHRRDRSAPRGGRARARARRLVPRRRRLRPPGPRSTAGSRSSTTGSSSPTRPSSTRTSGSERRSGSPRRSSATARSSTVPSPRSRPPYLEAVFGDSGDVQTSLDSLGIPYADFAVELSAPSRGVVVWSVIRELGREGVQARIRRDNDYARRVAELVRQHARLELITEPVLSICCFRYATAGIDDLNAFNAALLRRLVRETPYAPSSTLVDGIYVIRPCYINARTNEEHVDGLVAAVVALGDDMARG